MSDDVLESNIQPDARAKGEARERPRRKAIPKGRLLIGGAWVDAAGGETMAVTDPTTEETITHVQKASAEDATCGLASGIQTSDLGRALRLADRIKAGTVWLNAWHKDHPNAPFGGYGMGGHGREQGAEALENYTQHETVRADLGGAPH